MVNSFLTNSNLYGSQYANENLTNNMNLIANTEFACPAGDTACFCSQSNWAYGIRDCSRQACDAEQAGQAISYAAGICEGESPSLHAR